MISNAAADLSNEISNPLTSIIRDRLQHFEEARKSLSEKGWKKVDDWLINQIVQTLSSHISNGLLELSVEEITSREEFRGAVLEGKHEAVFRLSSELPPFIAYVEIIMRVGSVEILPRLRYEFNIRSRIDARNLRVTIARTSISSVSFGLLTVSISLSLAAAGQEIELGTIQRSFKLDRKLSWQEALPELVPEAGKVGVQPTPPVTEKRYCMSCGAELSRLATFCQFCGAAQSTP